MVLVWTSADDSRYVINHRETWKYTRNIFSGVVRFIRPSILQIANKVMLRFTSQKKCSEWAKLKSFWRKQISVRICLLMTYRILKWTSPTITLPAVTTGSLKWSTFTNRHLVNVHLCIALLKQVAKMIFCTDLQESVRDIIIWWTYSSTFPSSSRGIPIGGLH